MRAVFDPNVLVSALLAPIATPKPILDILVTALADVKTDAGFTDRLARNGMSSVESSPARARDYIEAERRIWEPLVQAIGLKP